jgi:hypothetical protein
MSTPRIDPSPNTLERNRRNWQQLVASGFFDSVQALIDAGPSAISTASQPLYIDGATHNLSLSLGASGGLVVSSGTLALKGFPTQAGDPGGPSNGDVWYDTTGNKFRGRENGASKNFISTNSGTSQAFVVLQNTTAGDTVTFTDSLTAVNFATTAAIPAGQFNAVSDLVRITVYLETWQNLSEAAVFQLQWRIGSTSWQNLGQRFGMEDVISAPGGLHLETLITCTQLYTGVGTGRVRLRSDVNNTHQMISGAANSQEAQIDAAAPSTDFNTTALQTLTLRVIPWSSTGGGATYSLAIKELLVEGLN